MTYRGARIVAALAVAGRDQKWLQRTTRLSVNTIDRLLHSAQQTPAGRTLDVVAQSLGVSPAWLAPADARRELTPTETAELRRCVGILRSIARRTRLDARTAPNVLADSGRRVPQAFRPHGAREVYRVVGPSLVDAGLLDGDLAYVRPTERVRDAVGAFVVARLNGDLYLKRLTVATGGAVILSSAADGYEPIQVGATDAFTLVGEVVAIVRESWRR